MKPEYKRNWESAASHQRKRLLKEDIMWEGFCKYASAFLIFGGVLMMVFTAIDITSVPALEKIASWPWKPDEEPIGNYSLTDTWQKMLGIALIAFAFSIWIRKVYQREKKIRESNGGVG